MKVVSFFSGCGGFIGGSLCQSWSEGGKQLGLDDERGKMFLTYISIIRAKQPKFFVIENVKGILSDKHFPTFMKMLNLLRNAGSSPQLSFTSSGAKNDFCVL